MSTYPYLQFGTFLTNHDQVRLMSQLTGTQDVKIAKAKLASDLLLTFPGVTYLYYGEEIGMSGGAVSDEYKRTPLQWDNTTKAGFTTGTPWWSINADHSTLNINIFYQQHDQNSLWNHYNRLIALRKDQVALRRGGYKAATASSSAVLAFLRQSGTENILVVSNTGASTLTNVQVTLTSAGIAAGTYELVDLVGGNQVSVTIDGTGGFSNLALGQIPAQTTAIYKFMDPSQTHSTITFQVDMNALITDGTFVPGTDFVDLQANFNSYGADSLSKLKDIDGDGIYTTTIPNLATGSLITYKYQLNGVNDGRQEYANGTILREYYVVEGQDTVTVTYEKQDITAIENPLDHSINVYPVPSSQEIFVEFSQDFTGKIDYQLCDMLGAEKARSSFISSYKAGPQSISCEGLNSGVYILKLSHNETNKIIKVIVQK
jgi:1,4-alpha-glucan branching enzyme